MEVNGFRLPAGFVRLCEAIGRGEVSGEWALKSDADAYGLPWSVTDLRIVCSRRTIQSRTDWMSRAYLHENRFAQFPAGHYADEPGFITDFSGVANFVRFAGTTSGETYAFDFGTDPGEPSVVYYEDYWRRVAPDFEAFMALFTDTPAVEPYAPSDGERQGTQPWPRTLLAAWVLRYVLIDDEGYRPDFEGLAVDYAQCSPEERREVEAEVRRELEGEGLTDEGRQRLNEVWERLRATDQA